MTFLDYIDWMTGRDGQRRHRHRPEHVTDIYRRISATPLTQIGNYSVGQLLLILLAVVGGVFLVIQSVAFVMGSVAGAVDHGRRARACDRHRARAARRLRASNRRAAAHDQLGDLADSFNSMTASVEDLLHAESGEGAPRSRSCASRGRSRCRCCRRGR